MERMGLTDALGRTRALEFVKVPWRFTGSGVPETQGACKA